MPTFCHCWQSIDCYTDNLWCHHDDIIKWNHFPRYRPFVRGIHRSPVNSPHIGQCHGALMFSLIFPWINGWVNNREAGDLRRNCAHYDVTVMSSLKVISRSGSLRSGGARSLNELQWFNKDETLLRWSPSNAPVFPATVAYYIISCWVYIVHGAYFTPEVSYIVTICSVLYPYFMSAKNGQRWH